MVGHSCLSTLVALDSCPGCFQRSGNAHQNGSKSNKISSQLAVEASCTVPVPTGVASCGQIVKCREIIKVPVYCPSQLHKQGLLFLLSLWCKTTTVAASGDPARPCASSQAVGKAASSNLLMQLGTVWVHSGGRCFLYFSSSTIVLRRFLRVWNASSSSMACFCWCVVLLPLFSQLASSTRILQTAARCSRTEMPPAACTPFTWMGMAAGQCRCTVTWPLMEAGG